MIYAVVSWCGLDNLRVDLEISQLISHVSKLGQQLQLRSVNGDS